MSFSRRVGFALAGAVLVLIVAVSNAHAFTPRVAIDSGSDGKATVMVNNRPAIRFAVSNGNLSPAQRASLTAERLKSLAGSAQPGSIKVKATGQTTWIVWGETNICLVTTKDAHVNGSTVGQLAASWSTKLRTLMSMPPLALSCREVTVPLAETRTVQVEGAASGPITAEDGITEVASTEVSAGTRSLIIRGKAVGDSLVRVTCDGESTTLLVRVKKYAGRMSLKTPAEVTGDSVTEDIVSRVAVFAAQRALQLEEGAVAQIGTPRVSHGKLEQGEKTTVNIPIKIDGGNYIPVSIVAPVEVMNIRLERRPVGKLLYSNNPESVYSYQTLFNAPVPSGESTRLLYHHQNQMGKRFRFNLELVNQSNSPARVQIIGAMAEPIVDTVLVGYIAGVKFLKDYLANVGYVIEVPANSKYIIYSDDVNALKTASGILEFREMNGVDLNLRVGADIPQVAYYRSGEIVALNQGDRNPNFSQDVFPSPQKRLSAEYKVGDRWTFIPIGKQAIKGETEGKVLFGNYGVIYEINVEISNPTAESKKVSVIFEPGAGLASGVFYIDGKLVHTKYVTPPQEFTITSYLLAPNQTKRVSILTLPLSGSAYPANILIRS